MTKLIATQGAPAIEIDDGMYDANFVRLGVKEAVTSKFGTEDKFLWVCAIEGQYDAEGDIAEMDLMTSQNLNVTSETVPGAVKVLKALLTTKEFALFVSGEAPDSDELAGRPVQVIVEHNDKNYPRLSAILPPRKGRESRG